MELKAGMYVRTGKGIAKYLGLAKDVLTNNESNHFRHYANQHLFDNCIFEVGHDWGDTLSAEEFKNIDKYVEKEPSYNPIDLIKEGDYVNGYKVLEIFTGNFEPNNPRNVKVLKLEFIKEDINPNIPFFKRYNFITNSEIKTIVTKEQFESMKYEINET